jgi:hypothetical protein
MAQVALKSFNEIDSNILRCAQDQLGFSVDQRVTTGVVTTALNGKES